MSDKLKAYVVNGFDFIHDSKGRYCPRGSIAWLDDVRVRKLFAQMKAEGRPNAIVLRDSDSPQPLPLDPVAVNEVEEVVETDAVDDGSLSIPLVDRVLSLHHTQRKKLASEIVGEKVTSSDMADEILRASDEETLEGFFSLIEDRGVS